MRFAAKKRLPSDVPPQPSELQASPQKISIITKDETEVSDSSDKELENHVDQSDEEA